MCPDICMCRNESCPKKETCYRYIAKVDKYRQAYGEFEPVDGECEHYWECTSRSLKRRLDITQQ